MSNEQDDRWYVQFDSQEVRLMTLDELDEAFQKGLVHDETYVIPVGASDWQTLGEILGDGSGEDETQEGPALPAVEAPAPAQVFAARGVAPAPFAARPASAPAPQLAPISAWPPVAIAPSQPAFNSSVQSMVPVVQDVSSADDLDASEFKPKKTKIALVAAVGLAAIGGIGVAIARLDTPPDGHLNPPRAAAAGIEPPTASRKEASFTSTPTPPPAPVAAATPAPSDEKKDESASSSKLSEDMKKALLAQDEDRAEKKKSRKAGGTRRASSGSKGGSTPFKSSGNAHDPLNDKL